MLVLDASCGEVHMSSFVTGVEAVAGEIYTTCSIELYAHTLAELDGSVVTGASFGVWMRDNTAVADRLGPQRRRYRAPPRRRGP